VTRNNALKMSSCHGKNTAGGHYHLNISTIMSVENLSGGEQIINMEK